MTASQLIFWLARRDHGVTTAGVEPYLGQSPGLADRPELLPSLDNESSPGWIPAEQSLILSIRMMIQCGKAEPFPFHCGSRPNNFRVRRPDRLRCAFLLTCETPIMSGQRDALGA